MVPSYYLPIIHVLVCGPSLAVPLALQTTERTNICRYKRETKQNKTKQNQEAEHGFTNVISGSSLVFMKVLFVSNLI